MDKNKKWSLIFILLEILVLSFVAAWTVKIDPYFHYHKPDTSRYFYAINNERSQNDGITRNFDYSGIITGTSMCQNFKTSEAESFFGGTFVKVPYSGGTYKEINDNIENGLKNNRNIRIIIRGLDYGYIIDDKDRLRLDMGTYPTYLYDNNIFNDVNYVFNKDIIEQVYLMETMRKGQDYSTGFTSFDDYGNWMDYRVFGLKALYPNGFEGGEIGVGVGLSQEELEMVRSNIEQNVVSVAREHSDVDFYYFFTPYSAAWWYETLKNNELEKKIEAEKVAIEMMLEQDNIKLFSINDNLSITADLNNYKDYTHYGEWINSLILKYMSEGEFQITWDNYESYLESEKEQYINYDYSSFNNQYDYAYDYYAGAILAEETYGTHPKTVEIKDGKASIYDLQDYRYAVFSGQSIGESGKAAVGVYNKSGELVSKLDDIYEDHSGFKQYVIKLNPKERISYIVFNDSNLKDDSDALFEFDNLVLY